MTSLTPPPEAEARLRQASVLWLASVRPDGRPHLVPVWFAYLQGAFYLAVAPGSVKVRNLRAAPRAALALEDGTHPLIAEGGVEFLEGPASAELRSAFRGRYDWDLEGEQEYSQILRLVPERWLSW